MFPLTKLSKYIIHYDKPFQFYIHRSLSNRSKIAYINKIITGIIITHTGYYHLIESHGISYQYFYDEPEKTICIIYNSTNGNPKDMSFKFKNWKTFKLGHIYDISFRYQYKDYEIILKYATLVDYYRKLYTITKGRKGHKYVHIYKDKEIKTKLLAIYKNNKICTVDIIHDDKISRNIRLIYRKQKIAKMIINHDYTNGVKPVIVSKYIYYLNNTLNNALNNALNDTLNNT